MGTPRAEVLIIGGGPAGLAAAIEAASRSFSVIVVERGTLPADKACGEGLMPSGLSTLRRLGVMDLISREDVAPFESIVYHQVDGRPAVGRLPAPGGLGIRRTALSLALTARARQLGVRLIERTPVLSHRITGDGVRVNTPGGELFGQLLVAADGLHSRCRKAEGLHVEVTAPQRFGLRRHLALPPWSRSVEVHFADGVEAYVTPAGPRRVGLAFLWERAAAGDPVSLDSLLARFPALRQRIAGAPWDSPTRGAGPFLQRAVRRTKDRFVLLGDAGGYVDAITGEGLSLAFEGAALLGEELPRILAAGCSARSLAPIEARMAAVFERYARTAGLLVGVARRPRLRRMVVRTLARNPALFDRILAHVTAPPNHRTARASGPIHGL